MVSNYLKYGVFTLALIGITVFSTWIGFKKGLEHGGAIEATSLGAISTAQISRLESGTQEDIDNVIALFEIYVNHGLDQFYWYSEYGNSFWANFVTDNYEDKMLTSVKIIAQYRKKNPESELMKKINNETYMKRKAIVDVLTE